MSISCKDQVKHQKPNKKCKSGSLIAYKNQVNDGKINRQSDKRISRSTDQKEQEIIRRIFYAHICFVEEENKYRNL